MADRDLAVYGAIFMPTSVINLVAGFVIRPYLTKLAVDWETGHLKAFRKIIMNLALIIAALTVLAVGGAWLLGIPVISLLYPNLREGLSTCRMALVLIIIGGALNAFMNLFYYSLLSCRNRGSSSRLRLRQRTCGAFFRLVRADGRNPGRRLRIHAFDGGTDGILWNFLCRIYETERESSKTR
ncbi:MAG: hypothetical protein ACLUAR_02060 [Pilosibacter sp.]